MHCRGCRLVRWMIFAGEKQVCPVVLQRDRDPVRTIRRFLPHKTADPGRIWCDTRHSRVRNDRLDLVADLFSHRKPDPYLPLFSAVFEVRFAIGQFTDGVWQVKVEHDDIGRYHRPCRHHCRTAYRRCLWINIQSYVITLHVERRLFKDQRTAGRGYVSSKLALGVGRKYEDQDNYGQ